MDSSSATPSSDSTPTSNATPIDSSSQGSSQGRNRRGKSDPAWGHCNRILIGSRRGKLSYLYCQTVFSG
ncbi:hypothetical protein COLO4_08865, partial [Corchorus olitorius]